MYHSLECRAPFLDYRVMEFTAQIPREILIPNDDYKHLLKSTAIKYNPYDVVYSEKKGFSIPVEEYFMNGWGKLLLELTKNGISAQMGLIDPKGIITYLKKHGLRANYRIDRQLFSILVLEIWLRVFHEKSMDPNELGERMIYSMEN